MLRHDDEGQKTEVMPFDGPIQCLTEQLANVVVDEQWSSLITRECQFVNLTGFVKVADPLTVR